DPGADTPTAVVVNWGDGTTTALAPGDITSLRNGGSVGVSHTYPDGPASFPVTVDVTDDDGAFADRGSPLTVPVTNGAPAVQLAGTGTVAEGSVYTLTVGGAGGYSDPGQDTPTAIDIGWGDG